MSGLILNSLSYLVGYGWILVVGHLLLVFLLGKLGILLGNGALSHSYDGESAASLIPGLNGLTDLVDVIRDLGNKDNIGSARSIIKNGGVLENEFINDEGVVEQRYWIDLDAAEEK